MFKYCNTLFERISMIVSFVSILVSIGVGVYFVGYVLNLGVLGGLIAQGFIGYCISTSYRVLERETIDKYKKENGID